MKRVLREQRRKRAARTGRTSEKAGLEVTRAQALFDIAVGTARNIVVEGGKTRRLFHSLRHWEQLRRHLCPARPLPKYQKGTLSLQRGNNPTGTDTVPILANEGEPLFRLTKAGRIVP